MYDVFFVLFCFVLCTKSRLTTLLLDDVSFYSFIVCCCYSNLMSPSFCLSSSHCSFPTHFILFLSPFDGLSLGVRRGGREALFTSNQYSFKIDLKMRRYNLNKVWYKCKTSLKNEDNLKLKFFIDGWILVLLNPINVYLIHVEEKGVDMKRLLSFNFSSEARVQCINFTLAGNSATDALKQTRNED